MVIYTDQADQCTHTWHEFIISITLSLFLQHVPSPGFFQWKSALGAYVLCQLDHGQSKTISTRSLVFHYLGACAPHPLLMLLQKPLEILSEPPLETNPMAQQSLFSFSVISYPKSDFWSYLHYEGVSLTVGVRNLRTN